MGQTSNILLIQVYSKSYKTKKIFVFIIFFLQMLFLNSSVSQVKSEWISVFDGNDSITSTSLTIKINSDNYLYLLGYYMSDILLIKYSLNGSLMWQKRYNGPGNGNDIPSNMVFGKNGSIYVAGRCPGSGSGVNYATIKYDTSGERLWAKIYTSSGDQRDAAYDIAIDSNDNVFVTGESYNDVTHTRDCLTLKYDSSGNQQWLARYESGYAIGHEIETDKLGNVIVSGRSGADIFTIKYNNNGDLLWLILYDGGQDETAQRLILDLQDNIYVGGIGTVGGGYWDYLTLKYDSSGILQWDKRYNGSADYMDQLNDMVVDRKGNVIVTGNGTQIGSGYDYTTIKYNTLGEEVWIAKYNSGLNDIATALAFDNSDNIYVTGRSDGAGSNFDYATIKYDSSGNQKWLIRYNYSPVHNDEARTIITDNENNVYISGTFYIYGITSRNIATIKYSQSLTLVYPQMEQFFDFSLDQNYPNPFNPVTRINYGLQYSGYVELKVYDVLGNHISTLVNKKQYSGGYQVEFDGSKLPSGIYFYKLEINGNVIDTKRMILLK